MSSILLTGGTGTLGRAVERRLLSGGHEVRILSRKPKPADRSSDSWATGDLRTGVGIADAVFDADTIVHCATGRGDVQGTKNLIAAAARSGNPHLIYISIAGIDRIPLFYYRAKLEAERLIEASGLPWTVLRATQFHDLVCGMFAAQHRLPAVFAPSFAFQTIDVRGVAARLGELAAADASGRVPDIGGPEVRSAANLAQAYLNAEGRRKPVLPLKIPGKLFAAFRAGANLSPASRTDGTTFEEFLSERSVKSAGRG